MSRNKKMQPKVTQWSIHTAKGQTVKHTVQPRVTQWSTQYSQRSHSEAHSTAKGHAVKHTYSQSHTMKHTYSQRLHNEAHSTAKCHAMKRTVQPKVTQWSTHTAKGHTVKHTYSPRSHSEAHSTAKGHTMKHKVQPMVTQWNTQYSQWSHSEAHSTANGHTVKHTVNPTFILKFFNCQHEAIRWRQKPQRNGQKLGPAPWQHVLSNCLCRAAIFGAEPNCSVPPTTVSTRSHSIQLLSLLKAQGQTQRSSFYICRRNSTEYCSMSKSHIKRWLPETLPAMEGLLEQAVCAEGSHFQGDWVTFYRHQF
jgi:hypothetical protein